MTKSDYIKKIKALVIANSDLINISALEIKAGFPKNALRKSLKGTRVMDPREALRIANVLHELGFNFSGFCVTIQELNKLPYR